METILSTQQIQRALISTSDKKGVVAFARALQQGGVEILSTGGTAVSYTHLTLPTKA